jgi:DNA topoisomerase-6 subunit B
MASVWVPFTSEAKEAIADYDEIRKEIKLALQVCGRRLGTFLRQRERAKSEFRRRNIFELYIEEVVDACNHLKGGKLPTEKLKQQLYKIAMRRTGGAKTDEILGNNGDDPEGLAHSIIVTPVGTEGEVPVPSNGAPSNLAPLKGISEEEEKSAKPTRLKGKAKSRAKGKSKAARSKKPPGKKKPVTRTGIAKKRARRRKR